MVQSKKGGFKDTRPEEILSAVLRAAYTKAGLDPALIEDIAVGNVLPPGGGASAARMAALHAGIPNTTSLNTVNRQCSSGLSAVNQIANEILTGQIDIGIGALGPGIVVVVIVVLIIDARSGSRVDDVRIRPSVDAGRLVGGGADEQGSRGLSDPYGDHIGERRVGLQHLAPDARRICGGVVPKGGCGAKGGPVQGGDCADHGEASGCEDGDDAGGDGGCGRWDPRRRDGAESGKAQACIHEDGVDACRYVGTLHERLCVRELTTSGSGNASQVSDGAAAVVLTRRSVAKRLGLPVVGKYVCAATVGVPPRIMGVGPLYAIPKVLARAGLRVEDVDFYEINEAFASQAAYSVQQLGIASEKVNVWGGAIALGHPLGCSECMRLVDCMLC